MGDTLSGGQVSIPVKPDATGFAKSTAAQVGSQAASLTDVGASLGKNIIKGLGIAGIAIGISDLISGGFQEASSMATTNAQLAAGIKSTGNAAGLSVSQMDKLASSISGYSGQAQTSIGKTEQVLQTFQNIRDVGPDKIFDRATAAAANMAAKLGGDASSAALTLGKALDDPTKNLSALTRRGVTFTAAQTAQIKAMQAAGNMAGAQGIILDQLNVKFGGAAKAAGETFPGQLAKLKNALNDTIGGAMTALIPAVIPLISTLAKVFTALAPTIDTVASVAGKLLGAVLKPLLPIITLVANMIGPILSPILKALTPIITLVVGILAELLKAFMPIISAVLKLIDPLLQLIGEALKPLMPYILQAIQYIGTGLAAAITFLLPIIKGVVQLIISVLTPAIKMISKVLGDVIDFINDVFAGNWSKAWNDIVKMFSDIITGMDGVLEGAVNGVIDIINGILKGINGLDIPGVKIGLIPHWNGQIPGLAEGGTVLRAGTVLVGEKGPELLSLPAGATVTSNADMKRAQQIFYITQQPGTTIAETMQAAGFLAGQTT